MSTQEQKGTHGGEGRVPSTLGGGSGQGLKWGGSVFLVFLGSSYSYIWSLLPMPPVAAA